MEKKKGGKLTMNKLMKITLFNCIATIAIIVISVAIGYIIASINNKPDDVRMCVPQPITRMCVAK